MVKKTDLEQFQEDRDEFKKQLAETLEALETQPDNVGFLELKQSLEEGIAEFDSMIAEIMPKSKPAAPAAPKPQAATATPPAEQPKWSIENHPAFQAAQPETVVEGPAHVFKVNEKVQARWKRSFVAARILSITGSSKDPTYYIQYEGYPDTASLKMDDLKPTTLPANPVESKKRKADDTPAPTTASTPYLSAEANINHELAEKVRKEPSKVSDGPTRPAMIPKKARTTKKLEAARGNWQDFSKGKIGKAKKESMFRTGEGVDARVGFTNSGHTMRKDAPRKRHVYEPAAPEEDF